MSLVVAKFMIDLYVSSDAAVFDNSYSWTRGKKLFYNIELFMSDSKTIHDVDEVTAGGSWTKLTKDIQITHL